MPDLANIPSLSDIIPLPLVESMIDKELRPLRDRAIELADMCKRFALAYPTIESEEADAKAAEVLAVVQRFTSKSGRVESARVAFKAPIEAANKAIGSLDKGPFAGVISMVSTTATFISRASIAYKQKVETERRQAAQAEANRKTSEARMAEELARKGPGLVTYEDAASAHESAEAARKIADAKPAELTRSHGDAVGVSSLRYKRVVTITAPHLVPRQYCVPSETLLRTAAGAAGSPISTIPGVTIEDAPDLTVHR